LHCTEYRWINRHRISGAGQKFLVDRDGNAIDLPVFDSLGGHSAANDLSRAVEHDDLAQRAHLLLGFGVNENKLSVGFGQNQAVRFYKEVKAVLAHVAGEQNFLFHAGQRRGILHRRAKAEDVGIEQSFCHVEVGKAGRGRLGHVAAGGDGQAVSCGRHSHAMLAEDEGHALGQVGREQGVDVVVERGVRDGGQRGGQAVILGLLCK